MMATVEVEAENPPCFAVLAPRARTVGGVRLDVAALMMLTACLAATPASAQLRSNAQAEQSRVIRDQSVTRTLPPPGRYASEAGQTFMLDRSGTLTLLRFERSTETWALRPSSAPRGDTIYRNDAGEQVLRVTPSGGITVYTTRNPGGSPVSLSGPAVSLEPTNLGPVQMFNLMTRRSSLVSEAASAKRKRCSTSAPSTASSATSKPSPRTRSTRPMRGWKSPTFVIASSSTWPRWIKPRNGDFSRKACQAKA